MADTAPAPNAVAPPTITPSDAGRTLAQAREARRAAAVAPTPAAAAEKPPEAKAEPPKEPETDQVLALVRRERELARQQAEMTAERKRLDQAKPDLELVRAIKEAKTKGDRVAVLKAVGFTDDDLYKGEDALFHQLLEMAKGAPAEEAAPDVAKLVEDELTKREQARIASMTAERQAARETRAQRTDTWSGELVSYANANLNDYKAIAKLGGIDPGQLVNLDWYPPNHQWHDPAQKQGLLQWWLVNKGVMPSHKELLDHVEKEYRAQLKGQLGDGLAAELGFEELRAPTSASMAGARQEVGSPAPPPQVESVDQIKERRKLALMQRK